MYVPPHFAGHDLPTLHAFIDGHPFGLLVSQRDGRAVRDPPAVPARPPAGAERIAARPRRPAEPAVATTRRPASPGRLQRAARVHLADVVPGGKAVPTWNYVAVHAYGPARLIEDPDELVALVRELTRVSEQQMPTPWTFDPADPFVRKLATQIVGFRIEIDRIEGKWKLNQNHPEPSDAGG